MEFSGKLKGKVALVAGATRGADRAIAGCARSRLTVRHETHHAQSP